MTVTDVATFTAQDGTPNLAVDVQPDNVTGTFVLDVSDIDSPDLLGWSVTDEGDWQNIVCNVTRVSGRRGTTRLQGVLTKAEATSATINLLDYEHAFDPLVSADVIHKGTPIRLRAWGYDVDGEPWDETLLTGEVDEVALAYQKAAAPLVTIGVVDIIGELSQWESEGRDEPGVGAGDDLLERVNRVLDEVGKGEVAPDSDVAYVATLNPTTLSKPWSDITAAQEAELGRVWVDRHNRLAVRARGSELTGPVRGTLSDVHGEAPDAPHCCVQDADVVNGTEQLANRALVRRRHPVTPGVPDASEDVQVRRDDTYSQARYGHGTVNVTTELETDDQLAPWAEWVILRGTNPSVRVDSVTPAPWADLQTAVEAWPAVCATDIGDRWSFRYHPLMGPTVERTLGVLGVELYLTPQGWSITWTTTEAPTPGSDVTGGWFTVDVSYLDDGDVLAPFGGTVPA